MREDEEGNMNEKMTDEELDLIRRDAALPREHQSPAENERGRLLAHIAALTAERDAMEQERDEASALVTENAQLRERVQALEAESSRLTEHVKATVGGPFGPEIVLLREGRNLPEWEANAKALESLLAAIRRRAGDERRMAEHALPSEKAGLVTRAIDRILGDDVRPSAPPEAFTHEKGLDYYAHGEPPQTDDLAVVEQWRENQAAQAPQVPEPTTSEAFATVRDGLEGRLLPETAHAALTLLERRMGAMEVAARTLIAGAKEGIIVVADINALESALTDALPVFTLADIQRAMSSAGMLERDRLAVEVLLEQLTALRRTP